MKGIDVSHNNGTIDWKAVRDTGVDFAIIKVSQGESFVDPLFQAHRREARRNHILVAPYHFFEPHHDAAAQAKHFTSLINPNDWDSSAWLDLEQQGDMTPEEYCLSVQAWFDDVEVVGIPVAGLYSYPAFGEYNHLGAAFGKNYLLWMASYRVTPVILSGWEHYTIWQSSGSGRQIGVNGRCDIDWFRGTTEEFESL